MDENTEAFEVGVMCEILEVSRSGFYAWRERPESQRALESVRLGALVEKVHQESRNNYGVPRVHAALQAQGETCGLHRVERLMREKNLHGRVRRRYRTTTKADARHPGQSPAGGVTGLGAGIAVISVIQSSRRARECRKRRMPQITRHILQCGFCSESRSDWCRIRIRSGTERQRDRRDDVRDRG